MPAIGKRTIVVSSGAMVDADTPSLRTMIATFDFREWNLADIGQQLHDVCYWVEYRTRIKFARCPLSARDMQWGIETQIDIAIVAHSAVDGTRVLHDGFL